VIDFEYYLTVRLVFGCGKVARLGEAVAGYGRKALIVTGKNSSKASGLLDRAISYLEQKNVESIVFNQVEQNPLTTTVALGVEIVKKKKCDVIVGLGGGSALDCAKAIAFSGINPGDISDYIFGKPGLGALPLIAVTTTAGTGSEGDSLAVLTNPETKDKKSLKSPYIYPKVAIVDPELMTTLPPKVIAATGIDVLCHAMEGYVARRKNPISDSQAEKAIELIGRNLPIVFEDPANLRAWEGVAMANTLGGMIIDSTGVALLHALEHPLSGLLDVVHGQGLAAMLINFMEFSYRDAAERFCKIAAVMGADTRGCSAEEGALMSITAVRKLLESLNLTPRLADLGMTAEHVDWLAQNSFKIMKGNLENNPRVPNLQEIKDFYLQCL
jgi:alcohol dehydrogenase class IV